MFSLRICANCGIEIRAIFGTQCSNCALVRCAPNHDDDGGDDYYYRRPTTTVTRYYTTRRPDSCDWDRGRDVERGRLREARDRGVNENGTRWSRRLRDFERERLDRYGGREYDREVDWEIRRSRPRRERGIFDVCYYEL